MIELNKKQYRMILAMKKKEFLKFEGSICLISVSVITTILGYKNSIFDLLPIFYTYIS